MHENEFYYNINDVIQKFENKNKENNEIKLIH